MSFYQLGCPKRGWSQIEIITNLSDKDKNDIINLYNHVITSLGELIIEEIGSSKSTLDTRK